MQVGRNSDSLLLEVESDQGHKLCASQVCVETSIFV